MNAIWIEWFWFIVAVSGTLLAFNSFLESVADQRRTQRRKTATQANRYLAKIIWQSSLWVLGMHLQFLTAALAAIIMAPPPPEPSFQYKVVVWFIISVDITMTLHAKAGRHWRRRLTEGDFDDEENKNGLLGGNGKHK